MTEYENELIKELLGEARKVRQDLKHDLLQYVRRGSQRKRVGVLLARKIKGKKQRVLVGWSKCKVKVDKFDVEIGKQIAEGRIKARLDKREQHEVPPSIAPAVKAFIDRCKLYFKTKKVEVA